MELALANAGQDERDGSATFVVRAGCGLIGVRSPSGREGYLADCRYPIP